VNGVYWIERPSSGIRNSLAPATRATLAVVLCPRGGPYLEGEIAYLKRAGIQTLVSLLSDEQVIMLDLDQEPALARQLGMDFLHHPIPDHELPRDRRAFTAFIEGLAKRVERGQKVGVHCWGSIGRATVTAACTLIHLGWKPAEALAAVEAARGCPVPDTDEQQRWILNYKASE
jgi:protein-tyrosine phosphatase